MQRSVYRNVAFISFKGGRMQNMHFTSEAFHARLVARNARYGQILFQNEPQIIENTAYFRSLDENLKIPTITRCIYTKNVGKPRKTAKFWYNGMWYANNFRSLMNRIKTIQYKTLNKAGK